MRMTTTHFFNGSALSEYLASRMTRLHRDVSSARTVGELLSIESEGTDPYLVQPVRLRRLEADFGVAEQARGIEANVTVPYNGDGQLFSYRPAGTGYQYTLHGKLIDDRLVENPGGSVSFSQTFPRATNEEVRAWAKEQVDELEGVLAEQEPEIIAHNAAVPGTMGRLIAERRGVLSDAEELRRGLGRGI